MVDTFVSFRIVTLETPAQAPVERVGPVMGIRIQIRMFGNSVFLFGFVFRKFDRIFESFTVVQLHQLEFFTDQAITKLNVVNVY